MRWMNIVLAISILALSSWADPGNGTKFGFNPTRLEVAQVMNQTQEEPEPELAPDLDIEGRLVPGKALLLSAILPGTGQFYAKNYLFAAAFLAIEVGAWYGVASSHGRGMDKETEFLAFADQHWTYYDESYGGLGDYGSYLEYEYYAAYEFGPDGESGGDVYTGSIVEWQLLTWNERSYWLPANGFTHELDPNNKDQQYYEMIGKYDQFGAGWPEDGDYDPDWRNGPYLYDDLGAKTWKWQTHNTYREDYLNMRKDSNDALEMSKNYTMVVLGNHLLSALHAGFNVSWKNRKLAKEQSVEGAFHLEPKRHNNEMVAMGVLGITF
ncbi:hypothetical protein CEE37_04365 [candidate division LCP-89 bacterium B3_LCP]|uniref:DUF5683 domain-containing protein n=1 Tax=candidate division LCP-89 bacterium B3_LCP TaxID=2012998 RepID=A0A532V3T8_UNCL8|nr:MAG: hypothetical protein CEE37_04365 [candidate division LCP-89 bacterium B3_LCP]